MDNDKLFTIYALTLIAAVTSVITASVMSGIATLPTTGVFLEHVALSFGFRAAYKSLDGFDWVYSLARGIGFITETEAAPEPDLGAAAQA